MDILGFNFGLLVGILFSSIVYFFFRLSLVRALRHAESRSIMSDLELATTAQLKKELRNRPKNPYILVEPITEKHMQGVQVEFNSVNAYNAISMLHLGTVLIRNEMKNKGLEVPDLPSYFTED